MLHLTRSSSLRSQRLYIRTLFTGRATPEGTFAFLSRKSEAPVYRDVSATDWKIARITTGSPSPVIKELEKVNTMRDSIIKGPSNLLQLNLALKAPGDEEALAIAEIFDSEECKRSEIVISVLIEEKLGDRGTDPREKFQRQVLLEEIDRLTQRFQLEMIDLLMLRLPKDATGSEIYQVSQVLEEIVASGRIQAYGYAAATSTIPSLLNQVDSTTFPNLVAIQLAFNAKETEVYTEGTIEQCREKGLFTMLERSTDTTNASGKPLRLIDYPQHDGKEVAAQLQKSFDFALNLEKRYESGIVPKHKHCDWLPPASKLQWAHILLHQREQFTSHVEWLYILDHQIRPLLEQSGAALGTQESTKEFAYAYQFGLHELLQAYTKSIQLDAHVKSRAISEKLDEVCPDLHTAKSLQERAVRIALSSNADTVLNVDPTLCDLTWKDDMLINPAQINLTSSII